MIKQNGFVYLTRDRIEELEKELHQMRTHDWNEVTRKISEARSHGDLSENAEYDIAKQEKELLEIRIGRAQEVLARARMIDETQISTDKAYLLSKVKVRNLKTKKDVVYTLVSQEELDLEQNKISIASPIGKALVGKSKGDTVLVKVPAGTIEFKILDIGK